MSSAMQAHHEDAAVLHVCLDAKTQNALEAAVRSLHWGVSPIGFDAYISADRRPSLPQQIRSAALRVALVDFDGAPEQAVESTRYLKQLFPSGLTVIAVGKPRNTDLVLQAMRAGCSEFLQKPVEETAVLDVLRRLEISGASSAAASVTQGELLSFFSAKGGVGTTTIAVHLAMYLALSQKKRVLLIDNHDALGHVCVYLGLDGGRFQFQDVVRNVSRLDSELLRGYVARHSSGLEVLASPDTCAGSRGSEPAALAQTLDFLRGEYDFVLIDSELSYEANCLQMLQASQQIYLTVTPEIGPLRDLSRHIDALGAEAGVLEKLRVVLNRFPSPYSVTQEQIESAIKRPVAIKLPNCYQELLRTENLGQPLPPESKTEFAAQIRRWSQDLAGTVSSASPVKTKRSIFDVLSYKQTAEVRS